MRADAAASSSPVVTPGAIRARDRVERRGRDEPGLDHRPQLGGRSCRSSGAEPRSQAAAERIEAARLERRDDALGDLVERSDAVDLVDDAARAVDVEDRRRLALVDREAVGDDLFGVVGATLLLRAQRESRDALVARHHRAR